MKYISDILIIACMVIGATVTNKAAAQESRTLSQAECRTLALANNETMRNMPENDLTKAKLDKGNRIHILSAKIQWLGFGSIHAARP